MLVASYNSSPLQITLRKPTWPPGHNPPELHRIADENGSWGRPQEMKRSPLKRKATGDGGGPGQRGGEALREPRVRAKLQGPGGCEASAHGGEVGHGLEMSGMGAAGTKVGHSLTLRECPPAVLVDNDPPGERGSEIKAPVR
ncbi:hypothetical protein NDU88_009349 [Pleurodeles waltl]|uniref:Uncharacterized protein n=1 Tax=Pleurodeles waltl TaxID=8319 RepID=A0AAV7QRA8_PLEWA|nr:hypothetical protein NDU88_009349 [Pleurodeles waltl]